MTRYAERYCAMRKAETTILLEVDRDVYRASISEPASTLPPDAGVSSAMPPGTAVEAGEEREEPRLPASEEFGGLS